MEIYKTLSAPILVQWEVTKRCNHNCIHCYNFWRQGPILPKLPRNYKVLYAKVVQELIINKVMSVVVTGGEPLMVLNEILPFIQQLVDAGISVTMNTNLTLLTPEKAERLKACGIRSFLTSLPSADPETNDYITNSVNSVARTARGIRIALSRGIPVYVNMVVSKRNLAQIDMTAAFCASLGVKNFAATRASNPIAGCAFADEVLDTTEFQQMQQALEDARERYGLYTNSLEVNPICAYGDVVPSQGYKFCAAGKTTVTIGSDGDIRPCSRISTIYGNITDGLKPAWDAMSVWRTDELIPDACGGCKAKRFCGGGCKADAEISGGSLKSPDPLCNPQYAPNGRPQTPTQPTSLTQFTVNPRLKVRSEAFGGILYVSTTNWIPVDGRLLSFFVESPQTLTLVQLAEILQSDNDKAAITATVLLKKKVLMG